MSDMLARLMALAAMKSRGDYYTKAETDRHISDEVARIVSDAPEDFDTLRELSDWIATHEESAAAMNSAIQANTAGVAALYAPMTRLVDAGAKNLFQYSPVSVPEISYVINNDGSVTVTADNTTTVRILVLGFVTNLDDEKKYTLSGITGGSYSSSYGFAIATSNATGKVFLNDGHVDFVKTSELHQLELVVRAGQSWTKTFYPMLCTAEDYKTSPEFVPYAPSNRELYEEVETKTTLDDIYGIKTAIQNGTDLNDMTAPGVYACGGATVASTLINCPTTSEAFILCVDAVMSSTRIIQRLYAFHTNNGIPAIYMRSLYSGGWGAWYRFEGTAVT
ncbi:MAG: hypothetical protein IJ595_00105 [Oscillospiraceae bacterium]|nr:hypothetical protein [Oscillospiraceae bacterium]